MATSRGMGFVFLGAFLALSSQSLLRALGQNETSSTPNLTRTGPSEAASVDLRNADSLLNAAVPRTMRNRRAAMAFTYDISYRNRNFTPRGKLLTDYSAKYEVIFVEGLPFRRQIEANQRPLTSQEAADEQRRYDQAFAERSHMTLDQKRDYLKKPWNVDVPLPQLTRLFANAIGGEENVGGRRAIVIQSIAREDVQPRDEEERRALHKRVKLWVDREDLIVSRIEATLVADDAAMKKGTVARIEFFRKDGVWLPAASDVQFETAMEPQPDGKTLPESIRGETSEINSDFHRFHVDVRLLEPTEPSTPSQAQ